MRNELMYPSSSGHASISSSSLSVLHNLLGEHGYPSNLYRPTVTTVTYLLSFTAYMPSSALITGKLNLLLASTRKFKGKKCSRASMFEIAKKVSAVLLYRMKIVLLLKYITRSRAVVCQPISSFLFLKYQGNSN